LTSSWETLRAAACTPWCTLVVLGYGEVKLHGGLPLLLSKCD
jgi:hypothetical protein